MEALALGVPVVARRNPGNDVLLSCRAAACAVCNDPALTLAPADRHHDIRPSAHGSQGDRDSADGPGGDSCGGGGGCGSLWERSGGWEAAPYALCPSACGALVTSPGECVAACRCLAAGGVAREAVVAAGRARALGEFSEAAEVGAWAGVLRAAVAGCADAVSVVT
jgi:hypothetical protein